MDKVLIYNTNEEMREQIGRSISDTNLKTRETLDDLYEKAMLEYKEKSGFNERFIKAQEKLKQETPWAYTTSPDMVHLPESEQEKFNEQYHDLGKGLELTALVTLFAVGNEYGFGEVSTDLGVAYGGDEEYKDISSMVNAVKNTLQQLKGQGFGAKLTPLFYTTRENESVVPEDISNDPDGWLSDLAKEINAKDDFPLGDKGAFLEAMKGFAYSKDRSRGLTEEECAEFEKLFYNQENSNTP